MCNYEQEFNRTVIEFVRETDNVMTMTGSLALTGLEGGWHSSELKPTGIAHLDISHQNDMVMCHAYGAGDETLIDWGEAPITTLYTDGVSSPICAGFTLDYESDLVTTRIQANLKLGVLVLGVFQSFTVPSNQTNYFFREFMAILPSEKSDQVKNLTDITCQKDTLLGESKASPELLLGAWHNTKSNSQGVTHIELKTSGEQIVVSVCGFGLNGPIDWGQSAGELFTCVEEDGVASAAILTSYDFGFCSCELQIRQNKGILAVTFFTRFHDDSGRSDYVVRELFHRTPPDQP